MYKQRPFIFSLLMLVILIVLHLAGSYYSLYWRYPSFDILVHIVSGLWIGLVLLWLASCFGQMDSLKDYKIKSFLIAFISAAFFGVVWELVENFSQITSIYAPNYHWNTALDIFSDAIGGLLAYLYFMRKKKCVADSSEVMHPFYNQTGIIDNKI